MKIGKMTLREERAARRKVVLAQMTFSQQREAKRQYELAKEKALRDRIVLDYQTSLCCHSTMYYLHQPKAMENEYKIIRVCSNCQTEAPSITMFNDLRKVPQLFIDLHKHRTTNDTTGKRNDAGL